MSALACHTVTLISYPLNRRWGEPQSRFGCFRKREKSYSSAKADRTARMLVTIPTTLSSDIREHILNPFPGNAAIERRSNFTRFLAQFFAIVAVYYYGEIFNLMTCRSAGTRIGLFTKFSLSVRNFHAGDPPLQLQSSQSRSDRP